MFSTLHHLERGSKPPAHLAKYATYATACKLVDPMSTHDGQLVVRCLQLLLSLLFKTILFFLDY